MKTNVPCHRLPPVLLFAVSFGVLSNVFTIVHEPQRNERLEQRIRVLEQDSESDSRTQQIQILQIQVEDLQQRLEKQESLPLKGTP